MSIIVVSFIIVGKLLFIEFENKWNNENQSYKTLNF